MVYSVICPNCKKEIKINITTFIKSDWDVTKPQIVINCIHCAANFEAEEMHIIKKEYLC